MWYNVLPFRFQPVIIQPNSVPLNIVAAEQIPQFLRVIINIEGKKILLRLLYIDILFCMQCDVYSPFFPAHLPGLGDLPRSRA